MACAGSRDGRATVATMPMRRTTVYHLAYATLVLAALAYFLVRWRGV